VVGLTDIKYTKAPVQVIYAQLPIIISMTLLGRFDILFKGESVWIFLALGLSSFICVTYGWLRGCSGNYPNAYLFTFHISLLLFFSFALAEIIVCLFTQSFSIIAWSACAPIIVVYALYIFFYFGEQRQNPKTAESKLKGMGFRR
jgi:hypothetical protein